MRIKWLKYKKLIEVLVLTQQTQTPKPQEYSFSRTFSHQLLIG